MKLAQLCFVTPEQYLANELTSQIKHEYVAGQFYAMVGTSDRHNIIAGNLYTHLRTSLRGDKCHAYMSDVKVHISAAEAFYYPDVFVTCDDREKDAYVKRHPQLIVEVLSPSTEGTDRREKLINYRKLESLIEYVLIASEQLQIEVYRRTIDNQWILLTFNQEDVLELVSVNKTIPVIEIYQDTGF